MQFKNLICLTLASVCVTAQPHAQERAAAGAMDTQMTWSALKTAVDDANAKSAGAHTRIDKIMVCNDKQMIFSPDTGGKDKDGCVGIPDLTQVIGCGDKGQIYDKSAKGCVDAAGGGMRWSYQSLQKSAKFPDGRMVASDSVIAGDSKASADLTAKMKAAGIGKCVTEPTSRPCTVKNQKCYDAGFTIVSSNCRSWQNRESSGTACDKEARTHVLQCS